MDNMNDFKSHLARICQQSQANIALPESSDPRVLSAACSLIEEGLVAEVYLFGSPNVVSQTANKHGVPLSKFESKIKWAKESKDGCLMDAGHLLNKGEVQAVVAGSLATTAEVIRAAIKTVGLQDGLKTVSGSFIFTKKNSSPFIYADCGVVIDPTIEQLGEITLATVATWNKIFSNLAPPHVAFLSFSTKGSASHPHVDKIQNAAKLFKEKYPQIISDGEMQFDAALKKEVGLKKKVSSNVPGNANCFIFPDLNSGNIAYKITQHLGGYNAYGPILQGLRKPYADLSRGASVEDIVMSACIAIANGAKGTDAPPV